MRWHRRSRNARAGNRHGEKKRQLGAEWLESRRLPTAVPTPAAIEAQSVAEAVQSSSPAAPVNSPASAASASGAASTGANQVFITNVYQQLLGRNPGPAEVQYWQDFLTTNEAPFFNSVAGLPGNAYTGAPANGYSLTQSTTGGASATPIGPNSGPTTSLSEFDYGPAAGNSENDFTSGAGVYTSGTNTGIAGASPGENASTIPVTDLATFNNTSAAYDVAPGQPVTQATAAANLGGAAFVQTVLNSPEYQNHVVNDIYQDFLHRPPSTQDMNYWSGVMATQGERAVLTAVLASPEYFQNAGATDAGYVAALYRDVLGRTPGPAEQQYWVSQLNGGGAPSRALVAAQILGSPEASQLLITNPTNNALADLTNGGYGTAIDRSALTPSAQQAYFNQLETNPAFESLIESMFGGEMTYQTGPGTGDNPSQTSAGNVA
ncbi:MAG TPA: DUF4214 domain-containing protein [Pirellulales bacterium]|nr:DUF4214 domain-containing protein [Pirellulales bacterium]